MAAQKHDPIEALADIKHEFGEHGGVNMSIEASTTFTVMHPETMPEIFAGHLGPDTGGCYLYGRHFNPTVYVLGREIAALEAAESGYCTSSGMSAIAGALLQLCDAGDHIVSSNTVYGGTHALLKDFLPKKTGIQVSFVDITDLDSVRSAITPKTKAIYCEAIANPTLVAADIPKLADIAHKADAQLVVDNTFSPLIITPIELGADVVVHSLTKFINGASDIIAGAIVGREDFIKSLMDLHEGSLMLLGPTMDPKIAHEVSLRIPSLGLRMKEHSRRAMYLAQQVQKKGYKVSYPGLADYRDGDLLRSMMNEEYGYGGLFTLDLETEQRADRLLDLLQNRYRFGWLAVSLGYFDTLMSCSGSSTSSELSDEDKKFAGISPGLVRISVGYTGSLEQRWKQLEAALDDLESGAWAARS